MAPKQPEDKPHMTSSSEEDEEQSASSGAESESTRENSKKDESSDDEADDQSKSTQTSTVKKLEAESEDESDSESGSGPEPIQKIKSKPESSTGKRSLKQTEDFEVKKKKLKTRDDEEEEDVNKKISGDEAKQMFQRLFSETDEIALLQGIIDFTSTKGDLYKEMDGFVDYVKKLINFDANRSQLVTKIQRLKKKFANTVKNSLKKGKSEDEIMFSKDLDQKAFELSRKIWGENGVLVSKSRKKVEETPKKDLFKLVPHSSKKNQETVKANVVVDSSLELANFFKAENVSVFGLDESELIGGWDMVADGSKKRGMEEKLKKLKAMQGKLCMQRSGLVAESAKLIFKDNASSSSGM